jgi:hypothetical protein
MPLSYYANYPMRLPYAQLTPNHTTPPHYNIQACFTSQTVTNKSHQQHNRTASYQKQLPPSSPDSRTTKRPKTFRDPNTPLPCCAVCLGHNPHHTIECNKAHTWDNKHDTIAERVNKALWTKEGKQLCTAWQREEGCDSSRHDSRHLCSGCSAVTHSAQRCPRAQKAQPNNALQGGHLG